MKESHRYRSLTPSSSLSLTASSQDNSSQEVQNAVDEDAPTLPLEIELFPTAVTVFKKEKPEKKIGKLEMHLRSAATCEKIAKTKIVPPALIIARLNNLTAEQRAARNWRLATLQKLQTDKEETPTPVVTVWSDDKKKETTRRINQKNCQYADTSGLIPSGKK